jgi:hypothetical protein
VRSLFNMLPSFAAHNIANCVSSDPVFQCKARRVSRQITQAYRAHIGDSKFRRVMLLTTHSDAHSFSPSFRVHVTSVVQRGSREEMFRVAANRIVAAVADEQLVGVALGQDVCETMNVVADSSKRKPPVASRLSRSRPSPAFIWAWHLNTRPKGAFDRAIPLHMPLRNVVAKAMRANGVNHVPLITYSKITHKADNRAPQK